MALVYAYGRLREAMGREGIELEAATVGELLKLLEQRYGRDIRKKLKGAAVIVNGRNAATLKGPATEIASDATVHLFPPMGGG